MNAEEKELFRKSILDVLDANRTRFGLTIGVIAHKLGSFGYGAASFASAQAFRDAIADDLQYLENKQMVEEALKSISKENRAWRISRDGIAFVDGQG